jgi:hypothetical protein
MIKIIAIFSHRLRNEAHYEFMVLFGKLLAVFPAVRIQVVTLEAAFNDLLNREGKLVDTQRSSPYTAEIVEADHRNDRLLIGIRELVDAAMRHYSADVALAAQRINERLKAFGKIHAKSYEEESAAIRILIADLQGKFADDAEAVGISGWVGELSTARDDFERLLKLRNDETAARQTQLPLKEVRRDIDDVYQQMVTRINAAAVVNGAANYTAFIEQLNGEIRYFNEHNHHRTPKDIKTADVDAIPSQPATGKEVTPLPLVRLDDAELAFAKDYYVTYRNNIKPGTAILSIHGKGAYRGQREVTFNIIKIV